MRKNGFTIVELLAVIIILGILMAFTIPGIFQSSNASKEKTYQTKMYLIEKGAVLYVQDHYGTIVYGNDSKCTPDEQNKRCYSITVGKLATEQYLEYDREEIIEDPRGKYTSLNNCIIDVVIHTDTKKIDAKLDGEKGCGTTN